MAFAEAERRDVGDHATEVRDLPRRGTGAR